MEYENTNSSSYDFLECSIEDEGNSIDYDFINIITDLDQKEIILVDEYLLEKFSFPGAIHKKKQLADLFLSCGYDGFLEQLDYALHGNNIPSLDASEQELLDEFLIHNGNIYCEHNDYDSMKDEPLQILADLCGKYFDNKYGHRYYKISADRWQEWHYNWEQISIDEFEQLAQKHKIDTTKDQGLYYLDYSYAAIEASIRSNHDYEINKEIDSWARDMHADFIKPIHNVDSETFDIFDNSRSDDGDKDPYYEDF